MWSWRDARGLARIVEYGAFVAEIGNVQKPRIDLGGEAYTRRVRAFKLDCNICGK